MTSMIEAVGVVKRFGRSVALDGLELASPALAQPSTNRPTRLIKETTARRDRADKGEPDVLLEAD